MNKKLTALAIGSVLGAAPMFAAQADVKVYGKAEVEVVSVSEGQDIVEQGDSNGRSRFGVKASEKFDNGMSAIANFEWKLTPSDGDNAGITLTDRQQWVGLKGDFGTIKLGRDHSAYKTTGGVKWDPYTATFLQARRSGGMSGSDFGTNAFRNDLIGYSNKWGGLSLNVQYVLDEKGDTEADDSLGKDGEYHVGVSYMAGPVEVIVATNHQEEGQDRGNTKFGARWKDGPVTAYVQFEDVEHGGDIRPNGTKANVNTTDGEFLVVGGGYKFGSNLVAGNFGTFEASDECSGCDDITYLAIGLTHFFSKSTRVYGGYSTIEADAADESVDMVGVGMRYDF